MPTASTGAIAPAAATATPATQTSGTVMPALSSNILTLPLQTQAQGQIQQASQAVQTAGQTLIK
ncbi:MAG: hypothetical protein HWD59_00540 [Coxiellaceae bacterium]|nr:MAG: hypothetical protein HWD59_00540 [Coxiellaceae bacterium]